MIKVYGYQYCPFCQAAQTLAQESGMPFSYEETNEDFIRQTVEKYNHHTVPIIFIDDKFIGGYDELVNELMSNKI